MKWPFFVLLVGALLAGWLIAQVTKGQAAVGGPATTPFQSVPDARADITGADQVAARTSRGAPTPSPAIPQPQIRPGGFIAAFPTSVVPAMPPVHTYTVNRSEPTTSLETFFRDCASFHVVRCAPEYICVSYEGMPTLIQPKFKGGETGRIDRLLCYEYYQLRDTVRGLPGTGARIATLVTALNQNDWCTWHQDERGDLARFWHVTIDGQISEDFITRIFASDRDALRYLVASHREEFRALTTMLGDAPTVQVTTPDGATRPAP